MTGLWLLQGKFLCHHEGTHLRSRLVVSTLLDACGIFGRAGQLWFLMVMSKRYSQ
jgi:hypothetical protein